MPTLAARAGRSFHRKFTAATGQFVETLRLDAARILLSRGLPLKQAAVQLGLLPTTRLPRLFQKRFGISPGTYREMHSAQ
ncbi:helix-turn-helix domain-containing protein [Paenirhodobacter sp.]|uniref:helix-turn-helix domain-containing protein n=1 Tax=Paenirhodobacter sp. TaxID=1965326 RepID=UPI003B3FE3D5